MTSTEEVAQAGMARAVVGLAGVADTMGRGDLAGRLRIAAARATRPATIVCVVGEFKQGKSSLVNALVGAGVCPVDDDLATSAMTLIHHGADDRGDRSPPRGRPAGGRADRHRSDHGLGHGGRQSRQLERGRAGRDRGSEPVACGRARLRRHPWHGRARGRPCSRDARLPAVRRRTDLRQ